MVELQGGVAFWQIFSELLLKHLQVNRQKQAEVEKYFGIQI